MSLAALSFIKVRHCFKGVFCCYGVIVALVSVCLLLNVGNCAGANDDAVADRESLAPVHEVPILQEDRGKPSAKKNYSPKQKELALANKKLAMSNGAIALNSKSYYQFMESHPYVFVLYYAPWCYWSKATLPEFDATAKMMAHHDPPVLFAKVDCTESEDIADRSVVHEYPTIRFFVDGDPRPYEGRRYRTNFVHWINHHLDKDKSLTSIAHLEEIIKNKDHDHVVVVGAFPPNHNKTVYVSVARAFGEDVLFGDADDPIIINHIEKTYVIPYLTKAEDSANNDSLKDFVPPFVVLFSPYIEDKGLQLYRGNVYDVNSLRLFVQKYRFPVITVFQAEKLSSSFFSDNRPKLVLLLDTKDDTGILKDLGSAIMQNPLLSAFKRVATQFRMNMTATVSGNTQNFEKQLINTLGAEDEQLPVLRIMSLNHQADGQHRFAHKYKPIWKLQSIASVDYDSYFSSFIDDFLAKKVPPYFRSDVAPEDVEPKGWVQTVVGSTFDRLVRESDDDVFVEFYAPWCGYCRKMEPAYKELARKLEDVPGIVVGKIDAARNEVDRISINGYPTVYLFPSRDKDSPILYNGDRSTKDMLWWLSSRTRKARFDPAEAVQRVRNDFSDTGIALEEL